MPEINEIRSARDIGSNQSCRFIWSICDDCGLARWSRYSKNRKSNLCSPCSTKRVQRARTLSKRVPGYESKSASELGYKTRVIMYLDTCKSCGKQQWKQKNQLGHYCFKCSKRILQSVRMIREKNPKWTGGRYVGKNGYVHITVSPDDPFFPMAGKYNHKVTEHRLVMAKHLNRCLESWEVVHHLNGIKDDNRIENLELLPSASSHTPYTRMEIRIRELEKRVTTLEAENTLLKSWQEVNL